MRHWTTLAVAVRAGLLVWLAASGLVLLGMWTLGLPWSQVAYTLIGVALGAIFESAPCLVFDRLGKIAMRDLTLKLVLAGWIAWLVVLLATDPTWGARALTLVWSGMGFWAGWRSRT